MGEYLAAPALLDEPAVQQSFLSYFNTCGGGWDTAMLEFAYPSLAGAAGAAR